MRIAVILVHYRTPELAAAAVEALRRDAGGSGFEIEGILVDNGSDEAGRAVLEGLGFERIDPGENLGFAGGVNLGVSRSRAETIVVMNPDVVVLHARRRWRRHARRHWEARAPLASYALSGSLLALTRAAWNRVGPFDEGYRLYFEETDWLRRAASLSLPARYVPAAEAIHYHGRSAVQEARSGGWFEESARRFRERHYGRWFAALLERLDRRPRRAPEAPPDAIAEKGLDLSVYPFPLWVEVSPNRSRFPAAAERLAAPIAETWRLPAEIVGRLAGSELALQVVDARGRELACRSLHLGERPLDRLSQSMGA